MAMLPNRDENDHYYNPNNFLKLSEELLEKHPLPDEWWWKNETKSSWAAFCSVKLHVCLERWPLPDDHVGQILVEIKKEEHFFNTPEEAFIFAYCKILMGEV